MTFPHLCPAPPPEPKPPEPKRTAHEAAERGPIPPDEAARMAAVRRYDILDTPPDGAFDRIALLAARLLDTPIATVSIVDEDRIWFKSHHGVDASQIDRVPGLCASAIMRDDPYVVADAAMDPRAALNPLVAGELGVRFYAAAPLITGDGYRLGTLNVIDRRPRTITEDDVATLQDLAAVVMDEIELRLSARKVAEVKAELERLGEALQRSARPPTLPQVPGLELAAFYRPASEGLEIGGDFYDVFETGPGTWVAVIGDVCGKGVDASILMSSVRQRLRVLAEAGHSPSQVLTKLSESLLKEDHAGRYATLCYLEIHPGAGSCHIRLSCGGHPRPLLRRAGGAVDAVVASGSMLGAFPGVVLADTSIELTHGDALLLYTDGMVEQRGLKASDGERTLREEFASWGGATEAPGILEHIEQALPAPPAGRDDDRAMLLLRVTSL